MTPQSEDARELMTTQEVADYLRIKERKIYDLVQRGVIPCTRVTGKWLFRKTLVDQWLDRHSKGSLELEGFRERPPVIGGSHDPLLDWAVRESRCELAALFDGSSDGLQRFANGVILATGLHLLDVPSGEFNVPAASAMLPGIPFVLIEWAWREQGLMLAPGNPLGVTGLEDFATRDAKLIDRQSGAGSYQLLRTLMVRAGLGEEAFQRLAEPARSEHEVALAVLNGEADGGFGVASAARQFGLDFLPLERERYDLLVLRRDYFERPFQRLLAFTRDPRFPVKAEALGGYELGGLGTVCYNAP